MRSENLFRWILPVAAAGAFALTGCAGPETNGHHGGMHGEHGEMAMHHGDEGAMETSGIVNDECPIMGGEVDPTVDTVVYEGHEVGFCCSGCQEDWEAWSDDKKAAFVHDAMSK